MDFTMIVSDGSLYNTLRTGWVAESYSIPWCLAVQLFHRSLSGPSCKSTLAMYESPTLSDAQKGQVALARRD